MIKPENFMRLFFLALCTLFITIYTVMNFQGDNSLISAVVGVSCGFAFGCCTLGIESLCKQLKINTFNLITLGLFFGFLLGQVLALLIDTLLPTALITSFAREIGAVKVCLYMLTTYLGMATTLRSGEWLTKFIPHDQPEAASSKAKGILVDISALHDSRIIDLATTGIVDGQLIIPKHIVQMCNDMTDSVDDTVRVRGKRCMEHIKKLEAIPSLTIRFADEDSTESRDASQKLLALARQYNASILTGEGSRLQKSSVEGAKMINLNDIATALKPLANSGEFLNIKIQRYGKEAHQGIGYLDDGTMVVVNGGADFIGELIKTQVLSVKHTTSGRIIFCNTLPEGSPEAVGERIEGETSAQSYFAL